MLNIFHYTPLIYNYCVCVVLSVYFSSVFLTCEFQYIQQILSMSCAKICHFPLKHTKFLFPLTNMSSFLLLPSPGNAFFFFSLYLQYLVVVRSHLLPLVVLVKQIREFSLLVLSKITEMAFWVSWVKGAVFFMGLSVIKQSAHSSVNVTSQTAWSALCSI